jgi:hypothetical protein
VLGREFANGRETQDLEGMSPVICQRWFREKWGNVIFFEVLRQVMRIVEER